MVGIIGTNLVGMGEIIRKKTRIGGGNLLSRGKVDLCMGIVRGHWERGGGALVGMDCLH